MPKRDYSTLIGVKKTFRKDFGPPFQATVKFLSDNDQYVTLLLEDGSTVWEGVDHLILEEDLETKKEKSI
jgi:hypothetical protein